MFKSYYVVWKPQYKIYMVFENVSFKSYYVVWKPEYQISAVAEWCGLNRTM